MIFIGHFKFQAVSLREADPRDVAPIKATLFNALKAYEIAIPDNYAVSDIDAFDDVNARITVFALLRHGAVICFIVLKQMRDSVIERKRLYLSAVGGGLRLGEHLLNYAIAFADKHHYRAIQLETTSKFEVSRYRVRDHMGL